MTNQAINPASTLSRNPELVAVEMDGETVMMDVETGQYFGLDPIGSFVWQLLDRPHSVGSIAAKVREEFEVPADADVEADMLEFLNDLHGSGLVRSDSGIG